MSRRKNSDAAKPGSRLGTAEREVVEYFVQLARYLAMPRSVGEIYGFLFAAGEPCTLDDLVSGLGVSKGSASQGLRLLRGAGAVRVAYKPGDRKDYYTAEVEFPALVRGWLNDQLSVQLDHADARLTRLRDVVDNSGDSAPRGLGRRLERLQSWHRKAKRMLPLAAAFLKM